MRRNDKERVQTVYRLSFMIPVFDENCEMLSNTVDSVLHQKDIRVDSDVQIVIVDCTESMQKKELLSNLSAPNTHVVQFAFSQKPHMAMALKQGLKAVKNPFLAILNCGDTVSADFASDCFMQFSRHPAVPFVAVRAFCFNPSLNREEESVLNEQRFDRPELIDLTETPNLIHTSLHAAVFKTNVLRNADLNASLPYEYAQDFLLKLFLKVPFYATASQARYNYFMPQEDNYLYHLPANFKDWYAHSIETFLLPLLDYCEAQIGEIPGFVHFHTMYYLQSRFLSNMNNRNKKTMDQQELEAYLELVRKVLLRTDDRYILNKNKYKSIHYSLEAALMFMHIKEQTDQLPLIHVEGNQEAYLNLHKIHLSNLTSMRLGIHVMDYSDGKLKIDGSFRNVFIAKNLRLTACFCGKNYVLENNDRYSLTKYFGISAYKKFTFHIEFPLDPSSQVQTLAFYATVNQTKVKLHFSFLHHWAKLTLKPKHSYWRFNRYYARYLIAERELIIRRASALKTWGLELRFLPELFMESKKYFLLRLLYDVTKPLFLRKKIWLMYDKMYKGGDSCEYLYRKTAKLRDGITKYYVIDKETSDYKNLVADGYKPLVNKSLWHRLAFLHADILLITNSNLFPFNGYNMDRSRFIRGLCNFGSMCLQHGLTVQKCAMAQQRIIDNTKLYFLASRYEEQNLLHHAYNYKGFDALRITGIGRYDGLVSDSKRQILLSPTWRMYNAMPVTSSEGVQREYNPEFRHTVYYQIYNGLINNEKLLATARRTGYKIKYLLHPILSAQADDFTPPEDVEVIPSVGDLSYEKILTQSDLMVTDYSGVQFDFAYMKKPLVYFHPSQLPAHYEDGCFFYDTMGFGEICTESDQLVDLLCEYMENDCRMKEKYIKRVDDFYHFHDHNNCQRIYAQILAYQEQVDKDKLRKKEA